MVIACFSLTSSLGRHTIFARICSNSSTRDLSEGGYEAILLAPPNPLVALIGTFIVFLIVVYVESSRIELPLAHG